MLYIFAKHTDRHANIILRAAPKNRTIARQWKFSILLDGFLT